MVKLQNIDLRYKFVVDLLQCLAEALQVSAKPAEQSFQGNEHQRPAILVDQSRIWSGLVWSNCAVDVEVTQKQ